MSAPKRKSCADRERERIVDRLLEAASDAMRTALADGRYPSLALGLFEAIFYVVDADNRAELPMPTEWLSWWRDALETPTKPDGRWPFHRCRDCLKKSYPPATRCASCGGELHGVTYAKGAA